MQSPAHSFRALHRPYNLFLGDLIGPTADAASPTDTNVKAALLLTVSYAISNCLRRTIVLLIIVCVATFPSADLCVAQNVYRVSYVGRKCLFLLLLLFEPSHLMPQIIPTFDPRHHVRNIRTVTE